MSGSTRREQELEARIRALEDELQQLRSGVCIPLRHDTVSVPEPFGEVFNAAQDTVGAYFQSFRSDPSRGTVEINGERYVLVRAQALSFGFLNAIRSLYSDRGDAEALRIGKTLLFDMAHVIGIEDACTFHDSMGLTDPVEKMAAGPVHFAYAGWAFVELLPGCQPSPDDDFFLTYNHPFSFESDSWIRAGRKTEFPVCIMNAGYSSGWCEESYGIPLSAVEITCRAKGDEHCQFVMAPPHRLAERVESVLAGASEEVRRRAIYDIPTLFERKDAEERMKEALTRAEAASQARSVFLANMSHEIRTPLTGLLGMAELLLRQDLDSRQRLYVETIDKSGQALLTILNDILDFSKIEAGMMTVTPGECDVRQVLGDVRDVLRARVAEQGLRFQLEIDDQVPALIHADPIRLRQIVMNLAANAVKFTREGEVSVRASWSLPGTLRIEVEDTGIGIEQAEVDHLFAAFTQADGSDGRRYPGTGLGLTIARRLVHLMGGRIQVQSVVDEGSCFSLEIPAPRLEGEAADRVDPGAKERRYDARVLVVEDDVIARYVVSRFLEEFGCRVDTAADGREAVAAATTGDYDLVLMDCQMPVMDGYEATARIRKLEDGGDHIPILAMTASVLQADGERCTAAGMDDFLGKPLDARRLQAALARWVGDKAVRE